jgi:phosphatidylserine decarboxylase
VIARGRLHWVIEPLIMGIVFTLASVVYQNYIIYITANMFFGVAVIMIILFRDPPRRIGYGVVSPIDGRVVYVDRISNSVTIKGGLLNVHVVRAPVSGEVLDVKTFQGMYPNSERKRQGVETRIATSYGVVRILKSARFSPKRARSYIWSKRGLLRGQRIATVLPVAYVTVEIPDTIKMIVERGQKVVAGESTIAKVVKLKPLESSSAK